MSNNSEEYVKLTVNGEIKNYFSRMKNVLSCLENVFDIDSADVESSVDNAIIHNYLQQLTNSFKALELKNWFVGISDREGLELVIDSVDSGFPLRKDFTFLTAEQEESEQFSGKLPSTEVLKSKIEKHLLRQKTLPRSLQQDLATKLYFDLLENQELFLNTNDVQYQCIGENESNGNIRYLAHWANYDMKKNIPNIYIMVFEFSGDEVFEETSEYHSIGNYLANNSYSQTMLLELAQEIDKNKFIHPKLLKRIHVGPIYNSGLTKHNDNIQDILGRIKNEDDNWVFAWSTEILRSKGQESVSTGLLSKRQREIFMIDRYSVDTFEAGASEIIQSMIIPYGAYQALAESSENPLHNIQKYVIDPNGSVIYL